MYPVGVCFSPQWGQVTDRRTCPTCNASKPTAANVSTMAL